MRNNNNFFSKLNIRVKFQRTKLIFGVSIFGTHFAKDEAEIELQFRPIRPTHIVK